MGAIVEMLSVALLFVFVTLSMAGTNQKGLRYLEENSKKEGVVILPSGLQYKVIKKGDGNKSPKVSTPCECHYAGKLIDGTEFDSSYKRGQPATFAPNQVIKGWTEAMQMMHEGDHWQLFIPSELAYGDGGRGPIIKGGDVLIFDLEMIQLLGASRDDL